TGFAICHCGMKMYVPWNSPKYTCNKCKNKIPTGDLETVFQEQLKSFFFSPAEIANYLRQADTVIKEKNELLQNLSIKSKKLQEDMDQLFQLYLDKHVPKEGFGLKYNPIYEQYQQIQEQIPTLQGEIDFLKIQY